MSGSQEQLTKIQGTIERVTFHNPQTTFCVLKVKSGTNTHVVVGLCPYVSEGQLIKAEGSWVMNDQYGLQLKSDSIQIALPQSVSAIEKYLASGSVKGIGKHFAKRLLEHFGESVIEVIEKQPKRLLEMDGIGRQRMQQIHKAWTSQSDMRDIMIFLHENGFGSHRAHRVYRCYGKDAIARIKANPYCLTQDIQGIGFKSADAMAMNMGIGQDSPVRLAAASLHVLSLAQSSGHTVIERSKLVEDTAELLAVDPTLVSDAIQQNIIEGRLIECLMGTEVFVTNPEMAEAEESIAKHLIRLLEGKPRWQSKSNDSKAVEKPKQAEKRISLSESQHEALSLMLKHPVVVLTGGPGVGKTTLVNSYIQMATQHGALIQLCAPTGRASKRLSEATGRTAKTIHRMLEYSPIDRGFKYRDDNPLAVAGVVVDEVSMLDTILFKHLLSALPDNVSLVLVGDVDQLPSVGPGAILTDIIASGSVPVVRLLEVFRQAKSSLIIENAHRINQGLSPMTNSSRDSDFFCISESNAEHVVDKITYMLTKRIPERYGLDPMTDVQILTPMNRGAVGSEFISQRLQSVFKTSELYLECMGQRYYLGDKVIQTINNYDKDIFNGDIGYIRSINAEDKSAMITFDDRLVEYEQEAFDEIKLAYAITIHKSQGSEYPVVIIPLMMSHYMMLQRNLVYTALTRGKRLVVFIGDKKALMIAVKKADSQHRNTYLKTMIASSS